MSLYRTIYKDCIHRFFYTECEMSDAGQVRTRTPISRIYGKFLCREYCRWEITDAIVDPSGLLEAPCV
jgi:hypothetical protein